MKLSKHTVVSTWTIQQMPDEQVKTLAGYYNDICEANRAALNKSGGKKWIFEEVQLFIYLRNALWGELEVRGIE